MSVNMPFVFLICSERSGSNFITKVFDSHPEFCGPSPSHLIRTFSRNIWRYGELTQDENWHVLCGDIADFLTYQLGKWRTNWSAERIIKRVKQRSLSAVIRHIYKTETRANDKARVFIKENQTYSFVTFLLAAFPDARFLYMVRDPRDVALSLKRSPATPGRVYRAAQLWKEDQEKSIETYGVLRDAGKVILSRYEDLLSNTEGELRRVCMFFDVEYTPLMLEFHTNDLTMQNSERINAWKNLQKPVLTQNFNKYRTGLSELENCYIEALCNDEMQFFGYQRDFSQTEEFPELEEQLLAFEKNTPFDHKEKLSEEEETIRANRMAVIYKIIQRDLWRNSNMF